MTYERGSVTRLHLPPPLISSLSGLGEIKQPAAAEVTGCDFGGLF